MTNPYKRSMLLISLIQHTKELWEIYKTEEIRSYLEYLKDLYEREHNKPYEECTDPNKIITPDSKIFTVQ